MGLRHTASRHALYSVRACTVAPRSHVQLIGKANSEAALEHVEAAVKYYRDRALPITFNAAAYLVTKARRMSTSAHRDHRSTWRWGSLSV